jgi:transcription elongation factor Elf1
MFPFPRPRKSYTTHFHCLACGHTFRCEIPRIYIHMPDFDRKMVEKKPGGRSPFVIPQHISCPQCNRMDEYELAPQTVSMLTLTVIVDSMKGGLAEGHPVKLIAFGLHDGTVMHPLDALDYYREKLERAPADLAARMRYANVLRAIGWLDEAKEQYQAILEADPNQLEAWLGLASLQIAYKHPSAAKKVLKELLERAPHSGHPERQAYEAQTRAYLEGVYPLSDLTPDSLLLHSPVKSKPSKRSPRGKSRKP